MAELTSAGGGESVSIVHVTAEYLPYARTGGLANFISFAGKTTKADARFHGVSPVSPGPLFLAPAHP